MIAMDLITGNDKPNFLQICSASSTYIFDFRFERSQNELQIHFFESFALAYSMTDLQTIS